MSKITLFVLSFLPLFTYGQSVLEKNNSGMYEMTGIVSVDGSAKELFSKTKRFIAENFKSGKTVTELTDENANTIVGNALTTVKIKISIGSPVLTNVGFTLTVETKDGRYKYSITNFTFYNNEYSSVPFEDSNYWKRKAAAKMQPDIHRQVEANINILLDRLKKSIETNDDDW